MRPAEIKHDFVIWLCSTVCLCVFVCSDTTKKVRVSKMTWWTSDADLENLFAECGSNVLRVQFEEEKANGKSKGIATVEFSDR
jgi:RNA recognition motif-containing protein